MLPAGFPVCSVATNSAVPVVVGVIVKLLLVSPFEKSKVKVSSKPAPSIFTLILPLNLPSVNRLKGSEL